MFTWCNNGIYYKQCPICNKPQSYTRLGSLNRAVANSSVCKSCVNRKKSKLFNDLRISWFNRFKRCAAVRGIEWDLCVEELWELYISQSKQCALTGWEIGWSEKGTVHTISIDRIDSDDHYHANNIQLVHKHINIMKNQYSMAFFMKACHSISKNININYE